MPASSLSNPVLSSSRPDPTRRNFSLGLAPYRFADLFDPARLEALLGDFEARLAAAEPALAATYTAWRSAGGLAPADESALLIEVGAVLGDFVADLFDIVPATQRVARAIEDEAVVHAFKAQFIDRRVRRKKMTEGAPGPLGAAELGRLMAAWARAVPEADAEQRHAVVAMRLLAAWQVVDHRPKKPDEELEAVAADLGAVLGETLTLETLRPRLEALLAGLEAWHRAHMQTAKWVSYWQPKPVVPGHLQLVSTEQRDAALPEKLSGPTLHDRARDGFDLTDPRMGRREAMAQIDYCLLCHPRGKDSCRHGLREKDGALKTSALGAPLGGCPLDERISEAHVLMTRGKLIAALAMIMVDNPMVPGTGHRICNDCMKACVFQKQTPVDIPQAETHILTEVLALPFGFEIYGLLTRFNPLHRERPVMRPYRGHNVLVVGLGPAGYTLAHYLLAEGFGVVAIDGMKLEPQPAELVGTDTWPPQAVAHYAAIEEPLSQRAPQGFGGVAEYGITVRWDKNFLRVIYLTLARHRHFAARGGIRFGGTMTLEDAWSKGFDHVALAAGAGKPTVVKLKNNLMRGMRTASDFLMGLQQGGAFRDDSFTNLQVELPAVVIGGGLTAVDTATELAAYYPVQIKKVARLVETLGHETVMADLDDEERLILARMLDHAAQLRHELTQPDPNVPALVRRWGGVAVAYRRPMTASPAYRLNHEEVQKALEEGVHFIEQVQPVGAVPDAYGHVDGLTVTRADGTETVLPARAVIMAAGTAPNTIYERELPGTFALDANGRFFASHALRETETGAMALTAVPATDRFGVFTSYVGDRGAHGVPQMVSFYGDNHPRYAGNVVKAMASAKHGHREVVKLFAQHPGDPTLEARQASWQNLVARLDDDWVARVHQVIRLAPTIVEVVVRAPAQARKFLAGQFYRLQNFERDAVVLGGQRLSMEGLALTGAWVDKEAGLLGMIALEMGVSSRLVARLQPGQEVALMGPTGAPTEIPEGETVMLCGGGLGNAVLFSVAEALRARGNRVLYFAAYRSSADIYKQSEVEAHADQVIWSVDRGPAPAVRRPQDRAYVGNIIQAMLAYAAGELGEAVVPMPTVDRVIAIGSDRMMAAVAQARKSSLREALPRAKVAVASINSPMQCMLKEVCAQCLQRHIDPVTGAETYVFSCFNQDQPQDTMDWQHLSARLRQNTVLEKISGRYVQNLFERHTP